MLASLLFILAADPASATAAPNPVTTVVATRGIQGVGDPNKVICRAEEMTGSRLGNIRVCMTKAQWDDRAKQDQDVLEHDQRQAYQSQR